MLALLAIILYPIGVPSFTACLLYLEHDALRNEHETRRSVALAFLYSEYEPTFFFWELVEISRKLILVGFMVLVSPGTMYQLLIGLFIAFVRDASGLEPLACDGTRHPCRRCGRSAVGWA